MIKELKFALYAIKKNIQSSAELRTSFLMNVFGMMINNTSFIIVWGFFVKSVGVIGGWTVADIIALQGFTAVCYGIVLSVGFGIRKTAEYVATGSFDRFMLSPKNLLVRIATSAFSASALGDVVFGIVCLLIYISLANATFYQILLIFLLIVITTLIFWSVVTVISSASFLFVDANLVTTGLFEFFFSPSLFHGGAFQGVLRFVFTFLIPSLLIGALPVEIVKDLSLDKLLLVGVLAIFWFVLSVKIFNRAVRRYESSNFMTFGS